MSTLLTVHDPRGYAPKVTGKRLAPRLPTLENKLIHLVDCLFDNSEVFMQQLQAWFAEHMPGVRTEIVKPVMRAKVVKEADAAVFAVGL